MGPTNSGELEQKGAITKQVECEEEIEFGETETTASEGGAQLWSTVCTEYQELGPSSIESDFIDEPEGRRQG